MSDEVIRGEPRPVSSHRLATAVAALVVTMPAWWVLGIDQAVWLAAGFGLGLYALQRQEVDVRLALLSGLFLGIALLSGVLSAQGIRWITLTRELLIISALVGAVIGVAALARHSQQLFVVLGSLGAFLTVSAMASIFAYVTQEPLTFITPIAPLVPEVIASTRLGAISLIERDFGTTSYFLGLEFLRPDGFFLFSTSEAVAQATAVPLLLALARWTPRYRPWLIAASVLNLASLLATTTRAPIAALAFAALVVWFARQVVIGHIRIEIPLMRPVLAVAAIVVAAGLTAAVFSGAGEPFLELVMTRSGEARTSLYKNTIDRWLERPILGWGTEVDFVPTPVPVPTPTAEATPPPTPTRPAPTATPTPIPTPSPTPVPPEDQPPLGSHSQYLGVLFKQGLLGLMAFAAVVGLSLRRALTLFRSARPGGDLVLTSVLTTVGAGISEQLWLDPAAAFAVASAWGLALGLGVRRR